jgi:hypothetical protein
MTLLLLSGIGLCLFVVGYYFGKQMGRTHFIRDYLSEARKVRN